MNERKQVIVVGSGPGGALTACLLAEGGWNVTILEEGGDLPLQESHAFTTHEIIGKYRSGGLTVAFGRPNISYVEGRVVGGGSEINGGFYQRLPDEVVQAWREDFQVNLSSLELEEMYRITEAELNVQESPENNAQGASVKLKEGAENFGWQCPPALLWYHQTPQGVRRSAMSKTYLPRALAAGASLFSNHRANKIHRDRDGWLVSGRGFQYHCEKLFLCAGAIQTAALLLRSGFRRNIGRQLHMHPTLKMAAEFSSPILQDAHFGSHRIKEFAPTMSMGCSMSRPPYLAAALLDYPKDIPQAISRSNRHAIYYCAIKGAGKGRVRILPGFHDPWVSYNLENSDAENLMLGLKRLSDALFSAGAITMYPGVRGGHKVTLKDRSFFKLNPEKVRSRMRLATYHLMGSCPMGENRDRCATDSYGKVRGAENLWINDASLLCTSVGANPQGGIMALARRNCEHFLNG